MRRWWRWLEIRWLALRWRLVIRIWPKDAGTAYSCANRAGIKTMFGPFEYHLCVRDTAKNDGYSREELMEMLTVVRLHERLQGWRAPEPDDLDLLEVLDEGLGPGGQRPT